MEEEADRDTQTKLQEIQQVGRAKGKKVVEDLVVALVTVKPEPPEK
jgi:hypothetical protein